MSFTVIKVRWSGASPHLSMRYEGTLERVEADELIEPVHRPAVSSPGADFIARDARMLADTLPR